MLPSQRLTLEMPVVNGVELLAAARRQLRHPIKWSAPDALHFTFFFVGRPSELFEAVRRVGSGGLERPLSEDQFLVGLADWLRQHRDRFCREVPVKAEDFGTLGPGPHFAAVTFLTRLPAELTLLHDDVLQDFARLLEQRFEVPDGQAFIRTSEVIGFSGKSWKPHVTVGRSPHRFGLRSDALPVRLGALSVRNGPSIGLGADSV